MSNPFASGSNSEPIGGIQPNDGGGGRGGSAFPQTSSGKVGILGVVSFWGDFRDIPTCQCHSNKSCCVYFYLKT